MDVNRYSNLFKALGDPNRLRIIAMLQDGEKCANDILEQIEISQSTLSHHLKQLTDADLIVTYRDGKMLYYSINNDTFEKCRDTLGMLMTLPVTQLPVNDVKRQSERALSLVVGKLIKYMCVIDIPSDVYQVIEQTEDGLVYSDCMPNAERNLTSSLEFVLSADDKAIGRKFTDFSTLDTRVKWNESEDMLSFSFESPSIGWVKASFLATDFDEEGNVQKVIYLLQDISKEKKDEKIYQDKIAHLIEQRKHEDVLQQEFFARMSATLRNPLNGITGTVDVLRKVADDEDKVLCYAGKIEQSSLNLLTLIKDMSEMSEMESGKLTFVDEPNNIWDLIHDISTIVEPVAEKSSVNFEKKKSGRIVHPDIVCSGGHFRYLLRVILCNAIAACEAGDTVCLAFKEQDMFGDKASFLFVIEDNGSGERNETELPVCRQIVEKMGGVMQVENRVETGMKVSMMLPFEVEESWKEHLDKEEHMLFRGKRVLLVEDNELNLEIAQFLLEDAGAKVTTAVDGEEAIALYEQSEEGEYDIIMMDIMMPKMDGLTAATEIRKKKRRDAITVPILAMSANAMSGDREKSLDAGMNAHVCKPLNMNKLVSAAKELMNREGI